MKFHQEEEKKIKWKNEENFYNINIETYIQIKLAIIQKQQS